LKIQQNARLALYAALEFAADPTRQFSAGEIAAKYRVSTHHLAKVLRKLGRAGLRRAARGVGGGYRFAATAQRVTLLDVIGLFEEIGAAKPRGARNIATSEISSPTGDRMPQVSSPTSEQMNPATPSRFVPARDPAIGRL